MNESQDVNALQGYLHWVDNLNRHCNHIPGLFEVAYRWSGLVHFSGSILTSVLMLAQFKLVGRKYSCKTSREFI